MSSVYTNLSHSPDLHHFRQVVAKATESVLVGDQRRAKADIISQICPLRKCVLCCYRNLDNILSCYS